MLGQPLTKISMEDAMDSVSSQTTLLPFATEEVQMKNQDLNTEEDHLPIYRVKSKNVKVLK